MRGRKETFSFLSTFCAMHKELIFSNACIPIISQHNEAIQRAFVLSKVLCKHTTETVAVCMLLI